MSALGCKEETPVQFDVQVTVCMYIDFDVCLRCRPSSCMPCVSVCLIIHLETVLLMNWAYNPEGKRSELEIQGSFL